MKIIFFGTPQFSAEILEEIVKDPIFEVIAVVTQEDKPVGRGNQMTQPPVKKTAERANIKVIQPKNIKELVEKLKEFESVDFFIVVAFGMILSQEILELPKICPLNIHASILPKYRGASPISEAILNGDKKTGISFMIMDEELDHGPVYKIVETNIKNTDTTETLTNKLRILATKHLPKTFEEIATNKIKATPQNHTQATICKKIKKRDGKIDFTKNAEDIENMIRAYTPWPSVFFKMNDKKIKLIQAETSDENIKAGTFIIEGKTLKIGTNKGTLIPKILKPEGKRELKVEEFINGYKTFIQSINQNNA